MLPYQYNEQLDQAYLAKTGEMDQKTITEAKKKPPLA